MQRFVVAPCAAAVPMSAAAAAVEDDERSVAQCINTYNVDDRFRGNHARDLPENPGVILQLRTCRWPKLDRGRANPRSA